MSNRLEDLHTQYKRYYFKKMLKLLGLLALVCLLSLGGYILLENMQESPLVKSTEVQVERPAVVQESKPAVEPSYVLSVSNIALEQSVKSIEEKALVPKKVPVPVKKEQKQIYAVTEPAAEKTFENYFSKPEQEKSLEAWIEKYNQKRSYTLAITIAKQYYFDNDFNQSSIWSKRANQLDRDKEEAWLYYAKSVHAMGDEAKAKKILNIYLQYKESAKAEMLLVEWNQ